MHTGSAARRGGSNGGTTRALLALRHLLYSWGGALNPDLRISVQLSTPSTFVDAAGMTASFELGIEEGGHAIERVRNGEVSGGKAEDVGVVVLPGEAGDVRPPGDGGTHFGMLVGGHGHTIGAAADQDAHASFSGHPFCKRVA